MATTSSATLGIHIFGAGKGESIVLHLPNGEWGVVDCYASDIRDEATNPTLRFLKDRDVKELCFLCMTHPHDDHYRGMSQLLKRFDASYFWRPGAMSGRQLGMILKSAKMSARKSDHPDFIDSADELFEIFRNVRQHRSASGVPRIPKDAALNTALYPVPFNAAAECQIWAIAPSGRQKDRYEDALAKCFDARRLKREIPHEDHNLISMALLITFEKTSVILGGDVEQAGWSDVLAEVGATRLGATAVKVPHHGSTNGYTSNLWPTFASTAAPISVVTSYRSKQLPRPQALSHIQSNSSRVLSPCLPAARPGPRIIRLSVHAPIKSRRTLDSELNARLETRFRFGRCSFEFDSSGNVVSEEIDGDAGALP